MTPNEIVFAIREKLKEYVDDTRFIDEYLMSLIDLKRSILIRQQYNQIQRSVDNQLEQLIVMDLKEVDGSDDPNTPVYDSDLMRTVNPLPKVIELHHRNLIQRVATLSKLDKPINYVSFRRFAYIGSDEFEKDAVFWTIDNARYIFLKSNNGEEFNYEKLPVRAVFERPLELMTSLDEEYPANTHMIDTVINMIVQELAQLKSLPTDHTNDSADDATILKGRASE